jgi:plastocyanin domain-containing protein
MKPSMPPRITHRARTQMARVSVLLTGGLLALCSTALLITGCASKPVATVTGPDGVQTVKVTVKHGYSPSVIMAQSGKPLKIEFYRDEEVGAESCAKELIIPAENVKIPLPAHESQIVEIKPQAPGSELEFQCGMHMLKGKISFK